MSTPINIVPGHDPRPEETWLIELFNEMEKKQLEFLDEANKRLIELSTVLLGIMVGITAFGEKFPPPYLASTPNKVLVLACLGLFLAGLLAGLIGVQPRFYPRYRENVTGMQETMGKIERYKMGWFRAGSVFFGLGCTGLAVLVVMLVLGV